MTPLEKLDAYLGVRHHQMVTTIWVDMGHHLNLGLTKMEEEGFTKNEAYYWLESLTALRLVRLGWIWGAVGYAQPDGSWWLNLPKYNEELIALRPIASGYYGEMNPTITLVIKDATGLENYDLQDYVDRFMFDLFTAWPLVEWINRQYAAQEARRSDFIRFRNYIFIAMAAIVIVPMVLIAIQTVTAALAASSIQTLSLLSKIKLGVTVFVGSLGVSFRAFLAAMHFSTLVGVHKLALLVSVDYRNAIRQVYSEITRVSSALGFGPYFLVLAMQNTRNLILDVSTSMGMRYDLAEVQWLGAFQGYLKDFAGASYRYKNNPEAVFFDLARWVEKDALDKKGAFIEGVVRGVERTVEAVEGIVEQTVVIRDDLDRLIKQLPDSIRVQIQPYIQPVIQKFDDFIADNYDPYKEEIDRIISKIESLQGTQRNKMFLLVDRLKRPGSYLLEIDKLEEWDRVDQERKVSDIATRQLGRDINEMQPHIGIVSAELEKITKAMEYISLIPLDMPVELEAPVRPAYVKAKERETWYIGDY